MIKLFTAFILMLLAIIGLCWKIFLLTGSYPLLSLVLMQFINTLGSYVLLGIGLGLPIVFLASVLGWVQLLLLINGNIDPHLSREGFFKVLETLFRKI